MSQETRKNSDVLVLDLITGRYVVPLTDMDMEWPPPVHLYFDRHGLRAATSEDDAKFVLVRTRMSDLPDDFSSPHVVRAAEYHYLKET